MKRKIFKNIQKLAYTYRNMIENVQTVVIKCQKRLNVDTSKNDQKRSTSVINVRNVRKTAWQNQSKLTKNYTETVKTI